MRGLRYSSNPRTIGLVLRLAMGIYRHSQRSYKVRRIEADHYSVFTLQSRLETGGFCNDTKLMHIEWITASHAQPCSLTTYPPIFNHGEPPPREPPRVNYRQSTSIIQPPKRKPSKRKPSSDQVQRQTVCLAVAPKLIDDAWSKDVKALVIGPELWFLDQLSLRFIKEGEERGAKGGQINVPKLQQTAAYSRGIDRMLLKDRDVLLDDGQQCISRDAPIQIVTASLVQSIPEMEEHARFLKVKLHRLRVKHLGNEERVLRRLNVPHKAVHHEAGQLGRVLVVVVLGQHQGIVVHGGVLSRSRVLGRWRGEIAQNARRNGLVHVMVVVQAVVHSVHSRWGQCPERRRGNGQLPSLNSTIGTINCLSLNKSPRPVLQMGGHGQIC